MATRRYVLSEFCHNCGISFNFLGKFNSGSFFGAMFEQVSTCGPGSRFVLIEQLHLVLQPFDQQLHHPFVERGGVLDVSLVFRYREKADYDALQRIPELDIALYAVLDELKFLRKWKLVERHLAFGDIISKNRDEQVVLEFEDRAQHAVLENLVGDGFRTDSPDCLAPETAEELVA